MNLAFLRNKEIKNAGWLIGGKVAQMVLSLFVGIFSARYLGPSNFGLIGYGTAMVSFCMSFCTLGFNSVIVKDFFDHPNEQGMAIGSAIAFRVASSFCTAVAIVAFSFLMDYGEWETVIVVALCSVSLLFHSLDTVRFWFQSQYRSKVTAIAIFVAYVITSVYKIILLILGKNIFWFAFATSVDYIALGVLLLLAYRKYNGPKLSFSFQKGKALLKKSYHYILSGMMVAVYGQTDKVMLKQLLDEASVGYYAIATTICAMWTFVLSAIIDSLYPTIVGSYKEDRALFEKRNKQLYAVIFYVSVFVSVVFCFFGEYVIRILYGEAYMPSCMPLKVITWYTAFSYLGVARDAWIVCNDKQRYLKYLYLPAAIINVVLNFALIPVIGATGAALASLITQVLTSILLPLLIKDLRPNARLMLEAICLRKLSKKG